MPRSSDVLLRDILRACAKIRGYTAGLTRQSFGADDRPRRVIRNLEIIGEATKWIPDDLRARHAQVAWKRLAGLRVPPGPR